MDLNQATLEVANFDRSLAFYRKLGFKPIVLSEGRYARFELPSGASTLSIHHAENPVIGNMMLYLEVDDVDRCYQDLMEAGIEFELAPTDQPWLWREARFDDPTGNKWCLFHAGLNRRFPPWRIEEADA